MSFIADGLREAVRLIVTLNRDMLGIVTISVSLGREW